MGYDWYLEWSGMSKEEIDAQYTGYQTRGSVGYLRASYGWSEGNAFYHLVIFGNKQNEGHTDNIVMADPEYWEEMLSRWEANYRTAINQAWGDNDEEGLLWANEVKEFVLLGLEKARKRLRPSVECR